MDEYLKALQEIDPLWSVVLVALALAVLLIAKFWSVSVGRALAVLAVVLLLGGAAAGGYFGYQHLEETRRLDERRALDDRATALFHQAVQGDSVFACIDGSPVPAMLEACERNLFAEPQRVAAAVAIVTQRLVFLGDVLAFANRRDGDYLGRIETMRKSVEADPYGFVAFVLSVEHGCAADTCVRFSLFRNPERVKENMRVRRLEAFLARYSVVWRESATMAGDPSPAVGVTTSSPLVTISGEGAASTAAAEPVRSGATPSATVSDAPAAVTAPLIPPPSAAATVAEPPAAALAPTVTRSAEPDGFATPPRPPAAVETPPPAAAKAAVRPAAQAKAKAKADPLTRRSSEPVAGLPRVVPRDYIREKEEEAEDPKAQAAGQSGAPTPIAPPAQNFTGR